MLNIGRMAAGSQRYYLDHVARTTLDYHHGHGEAPGRWLGGGIADLHLPAGAVVTEEQLGAVLAATDPATGQPLTSHPARRIPGFDLTFRPPKSVSLLWGLTDDTTMAVVADAHHRAVEAAVGYLERAAGRSRRGAGGVESVPITGFVAAGFTHRTSREGDPLLHTHVLVANLARAVDDGRWRTLDSRRIYAHARTAGAVYQAALRHELTVSLGVGWEPVVSSTADIAGVPREWIDEFSKRRAAILAELDRRGLHSAAAAQAATLDTRRAKQAQPDTPTLRARWRAEARALGAPDRWWEDVVRRTSHRIPDVAALYDDLVADEGLTQDRSSFAARDLVRAVVDRLPTGGSTPEVERTVHLMLDRGARTGDLVELNGNGHDRRWTTRRLLELERRTVERAAGTRQVGLGIADPDAVAEAVQHRRTLSVEQRAMVEAVTRTGDAVSVVVGRAGTGKTFALDTARDAWERSGFAVTGAALAARAAAELEESAGIHSTTIASLLARLDDPWSRGWSWTPDRHVLVVDEAGMVGTRQLARLLEHAHRQRVKVVLVGDTHQLPEIEAGGLFAGLVERLPATTLRTNRRQVAAWEVEALDDLRSGDVPRAVGRYVHHGRVTTAGSAEALRERLVGDWLHNVTTDGCQQTLMIALRRTDVDDLNRMAHQRMDQAGRLWGETRRLGHTEARGGDRIVCLRNDRRLGVLNGSRGTVFDIRPDGSLAVMLDSGTHVRLPAKYVDDGHVTLGYAVTGHKAQGVTVQHTHVLGSEGLYRQWGYVAMSRGRASNQLYLHERAEACHRDHDVDRSETLARATRRLGRSTPSESLTAVLTAMPAAAPAPVRERGRSR